MATYKHRHELFVAGHNGTSFQEIAALTSIPCVACFVKEIVLLVGHMTFLNRNYVLLLLDFCILVVPSIISVTILSDFIAQICLLLALCCIVAYCIIFKRQKMHPQKVLESANLSEKKLFIMWYRSVINLMTALAILAVDFQVFPRRLAKTETYGFGGMDNGVGFFVIANAIVSHEARGKSNHQPVLRQLKQSFLGSVPLLILGVGRFLSVKSTDYHEHVTEYGVHWNFFFTLAAVKISSTLIYCLIDVNKSLVVGVVLAGLHQVILSFYGLSSYVMYGKDGTGSRNTFVDANREGIFSIPGYLAIYILGVALGSFLFNTRKNLMDWLHVGKHLFIVIIACTLVMVMSHSYIEQVSRRLSNLAFVFWIVGNACLMLLECLLAEIAISCLSKPEQKKVFKTADALVDGKQSCHGDGFHGQSALSNGNNATEKENLQSDALGSGAIRVRNKQDTKVSDGIDYEQTVYEKAPPAKPLVEPVSLLDAISYNALLFFLLANVMTGVINVSIETMYASDSTAVIIISLYLFMICSVIVFLRKKKVRTKVW